MSSVPQCPERSRAPVFISGCPRSGTTLLYHMLLSAGGFAVYRTESSVFNVLKPLFGNLKAKKNRQRLMDVWLKSKLFERSGLDQHNIREKVIAECRGPGDFLKIIMEEIARSQNVSRWADCTPEHLLYTA
ncbi:MAG: sulfotransferase, partial [Candidatus Acidiferrales bacterium]